MCTYNNFNTPQNEISIYELAVLSTHDKDVFRIKGKNADHGYRRPS
jgi:hypothetical protein